MLNLQIVEIANEPRVLDTELAVALGFVRPRVVRELIERNKLELQSFGILPYRTAKLAGRGRPLVECHLNEAQALLICMFARTPTAASVRKLIIEVFMAWRQGKTVPVKAHMRRPPLAEIPPMREFFEIKHEGFDGWALISASMPFDVAQRVCAVWRDSL